MKVGARDGDIGDPRTVRLELLGDKLGCFRLIPVTDESTETSYPIAYYDLVTTDNYLDREHEDVLQNGGIYTFTLRVSVARGASLE